MENELCFSSKQVDNPSGEIPIDLSEFLVQLAAQQSNYIIRHTDLSVGVYYGDLGVDFWEKSKWDIEFEQHQVLVFTAQVFRNIVDRNIFRKA